MPWLRRSGVHLLVGALGIAALMATLVLIVAFVRIDTSYALVSRATSRSTPLAYRVTGMWSTMGGSLLLWVTLQSLLAVRALRHSTKQAALLGAAAVAVAAVMVLRANPFAAARNPGYDGVGLTPILRHWAMVVHPPLLYGGLVATSIPWAAAAAGRPLSTTRRPLLVAWVLLSASLMLGAIWAYGEAGWGGYWGWDPVENIGLIPWLAITVSLHLPPHANRAKTLAATSPFVLAITGTAISRSDLAGSVHAFAAQRSVGTSLLVVAALCAVTALIAVLRTAPTEQNAERWTWWSLAPVVVVGAAALVVASGTFAPAVWQIGGFGKATVAPSFFRRLGAPVLLIGVFALVFATNHWRRRATSVIAHSGVLILSFGIAASALGTQVVTTLKLNEPTRIARATLTLRELTTYELASGVLRTSATIERTGPLRSATVRPAIDVYPDGQILSEPDVAWGAVDLHGILRRTATIDGQPVAVVEILIRPFVVTVWTGAFLIALSGILAAGRPRLRPISAVSDPNRLLN